jgi:hypothetical protein
MYFSITLMGVGLKATDYGLKSFEKTRSMQISAWDKWVLLDDVIAGAVQKSLEIFPLAKRGNQGSQMTFVL